MKINPNDSAFPEVSTDTKNAKTSQGDNVPIGDTHSTGGLCKREFFAAMAMQGLAMRLDLPGHLSDPKKGFSEKLAEFSVEIADALIAQLGKKN